MNIFQKFLGFLNPSFKKGLSGVQGQSPCPINANFPSSPFYHIPAVESRNPLQIPLPATATGSIFEWNPSLLPVERVSTAEVYPIKPIIIQRKKRVPRVRHPFFQFLATTVMLMGSIPACS